MVIHLALNMKSRPAKYIFKLFTRTDARVFYVKEVEVYVGEEPIGRRFTLSNSLQIMLLHLARNAECLSKNTKTGLTTFFRLNNPYTSSFMRCKFRRFDVHTVN